MQEKETGTIAHLPIEQRHDSMRGWFGWELHYQMQKNKNVWVVAGDLGYGLFDKIRRDFPERFINCGAAEQAMTGIAVGLAESGKVPVVYSITPFLLYRPFETVRNYLHYEGVPVKLVGSGRNADYEHDGLSHWCMEDRRIMKVLSGIESVWPETKEEITGVVDRMINTPKPYYVNLRR